MSAFIADNSNDMAYQVYNALNDLGVVSNSRNGEVLKFPYPITTTYRTPWHRANFTPGRDANPFFHIAEAMWMLAGRRDVGFLDNFNKGMKQYSDDGDIFNAAYGYRARHAFGVDQLQAIPEIMLKDPDTRQAVIQLWDPFDLQATTKDKACNMTMLFKMHGIRLDLIVYNRSNDLVYGGVTGANPVHFSYFQQWVADTLKVPMGYLTFVSADAHVYTEMPHWERMSFEDRVHPRAMELPLGDLSEIEDLCCMYEDSTDPLPEKAFLSLHLARIIVPILNTWKVRKQGGDFNEHLNSIHCPALMLACHAWIMERYNEH